MVELVSFFVVLASGLIFAAVFRKLHVPWVVALLIAGMMTGPFGFNFFELDNTLIFLGDIGLVFLMFMAGLEVNLKYIYKHLGDFFLITLFAAGVPFGAGVLLGIFFSYPGLVSLLIGTVLMSVSVSVTVPLLTSHGLLHSKVGEMSLGVGVLADIVSFALLSVLLRSAEGGVGVGLVTFAVILVAVFAIFHWLVPRWHWVATAGFEGKDLHQRELRVMLMMMVGAVLLFELIGLHAVVAGFLAGVLLSEPVRSEHLKGRLTTIAYGVFVPIFFVVAGAQFNWELLLQENAWRFVVGLVLVALVSKLVVSYGVARLRGFSRKASGILAAAVTPQLTIPIAVAFSGATAGILDDKLVSGLVALVIVTTLLGPILLTLAVQRVKVSDELS